MKNELLVFFGSGCGGVFRYLIQRSCADMLVGFPVGTILVNLIGSLFIGIIIGSVEATVISDICALGMIIGFLGGFTTFSAFSADSLCLLQNGNIFAGFLNIIISVGGGICAVYIGYQGFKFAGSHIF